MRKLLTRIKQWYVGFVDVKMGSPEDENFSISIKPIPASRLKQIIDWLWRFWRRNWANIVLIVIGVLTLIATLYPSLLTKKLPCINTEHKKANPGMKK